jgi:hypothetical protein
MYQGGFAAREDAEKKKEEYLLGKAVDKLPEHGPSEAAARVSTLTSVVLVHSTRSVQNMNQFACQHTLQSVVHQDPAAVDRKHLAEFQAVCTLTLSIIPCKM